MMATVGMTSLMVRVQSNAQLAGSVVTPVSDVVVELDAFVEPEAGEYESSVSPTSDLDVSSWPAVSASSPPTEGRWQAFAAITHSALRNHGHRLQDELMGWRSMFSGVVGGAVGAGGVDHFAFLREVLSRERSSYDTPRDRYTRCGRRAIAQNRDADAQVQVGSENGWAAAGAWPKAREVSVLNPRSGSRCDNDVIVRVAQRCAVSALARR